MGRVLDTRASEDHFDRDLDFIALGLLQTFDRVGLGHNNRFRGGLPWHRRKLKSKNIRGMMQDLQIRYMSLTNLTLNPKIPLRVLDSEGPEVMAL